MNSKLKKIQAKLDAAARAADDLAAAHIAFAVAHKAANKTYSKESYKAYSNYMNYIGDVLPEDL